MIENSPTILPGSEAGIARAANALRAGEVVAFGTETVYGLGADAYNPDAVARVFALKQRPPRNPLISHIDSLAMAENLARFDARARDIARQFWPGPLTLILPYRDDAGVADAARAGLQTIALRLPAHETARRLIAAVGRPLVAPSANKSGRLSPTSAMMVAESFAGELPLILGSGRCKIGLESTVLDLSGSEPLILRPGAITADDLAELLPGLGEFTGHEELAPKSPGLLLRHYAPRLPLRIEVRDPQLGDDEAFLGFGPNPFASKGGAQRLNLSPSGDLDEAARNLFAMLRQLEDSGAVRIAVAPVPNIGLGRAINDRLRRAAAASTATADAFVGGQA